MNSHQPHRTPPGMIVFFALYAKVNYILDEIVMGGMVLETRCVEVAACVTTLHVGERVRHGMSRKS